MIITPFLILIFGLLGIFALASLIVVTCIGLKEDPGFTSFILGCLFMITISIMILWELDLSKHYKVTITKIEEVKLP